MAWSLEKTVWQVLTKLTMVFWYNPVVTPLAARGSKEWEMFVKATYCITVPFWKRQNYGYSRKSSGSQELESSRMNMQSKEDFQGIKLLNTRLRAVSLQCEVIIASPPRPWVVVVEQGSGWLSLSLVLGSLFLEYPAM